MGWIAPKLLSPLSYETLAPFNFQSKLGMRQEWIRYIHSDSLPWDPTGRSIILLSIFVSEMIIQLLLFAARMTKKEKSISLLGSPFTKHQLWCNCLHYYYFRKGTPSTIIIICIKSPKLLYSKSLFGIALRIKLFVWNSFFKEKKKTLIFKLLTKYSFWAILKQKSK